MSARVHYRSCNLCEAMCGVRIEVEGERVTSIRGDEHDPLSHGYICPKAAALKELHEDPDRLRHPMRRTGTGWEKVSWDDALGEVARRLHGIQEEHGRDAAAVYVGNPTVHNTGALLMGPLFLRTLHTKNRFSATSVDQLPHMLVAYWMFGHQLLLPVPDVDRTDYFLIFGANPLASNGSLMSAPGMKGRLEAIRARGGRVVVVDPRRTETAEIADAHHFIQPGSDALLLLAMLHVIFAEKRARLGRLAAFTDGAAAALSGPAPGAPRATRGWSGTGPPRCGGAAAGGTARGFRWPWPARRCGSRRPRAWRPAARTAPRRR
jgi:anaerobic selenocysteine-containing dehydrogenase